MQVKDGQYYYAHHRSQWGIWQNKELSDGYGTGTFIKDCPTKEEAKREVYRLNNWKCEKKG